jgi:hypothetical protein
MTCRTYTIPALTGGTVTIVDPSNNQHWAFTYWGDSYWGAVAGSIASTTPAERTFTVSAEDRTYTVTPDNSDGVVTGYDGILVEDAGAGTLNGYYYEDGTQNGKPKYTYAIGTIKTVSWEAPQWLIKIGLTIYYYANEDVATPDLVTTWQVYPGKIPPVPTVTESVQTITAPASRTYTIPACED